MFSVVALICKVLLVRRAVMRSALVVVFGVFVTWLVFRLMLMVTVMLMWLIRRCAAWDLLVRLVSVELLDCCCWFLGLVGCVGTGYGVLVTWCVVLGYLGLYWFGYCV